MTDHPDPKPENRSRFPGWLIVLVMTAFVGGFIYLMLWAIAPWDR